ncbi:MAG TPA: formate--tetrahydrofolate ligase [Verrucomicrobiae bacterium]|jgi:formate--tetrahydrofolate ligase|nr:formate--tetrahydrofolate ligase [Verrucomicrobiae bacterium]
MPTSTPIDPSVPRPIAAVAADLGLAESEWIPYGRTKAKVLLDALATRRSRPDGKLVVVSSITPTPAGDGKTTMTIGLGQALWKAGARPVIALREPSIGPTLGLKGGGTGGGRSQVVPMDEINLHFTGDFHAITAANNLLAAALDNHLHHGNALGIDVRQITWKRALDVNDRALRRSVLGLGGRMDGVPREGGFLITAASEIMAVLCLAEDLGDLRQRLGRMVVAFTREGKAVPADALGVTGAMTALLRDAIHPNLVQTMEGTPALVHGGPFANIAHGCNSVVATRMALKLGEVCLTEAGFATDLGAEKFFDIKCRLAGLRPDAAMIVATNRALKYHGGVPVKSVDGENLDALRRGLENLDAHVESIKQFNVPVLVGLNRYPSDSEAEYKIVRDHCDKLGVRCHVADIFARGGDGGGELAKALRDLLASERSGFTPLYALEQPVKAKLETIARRIYGADGVVMPARVERQIAEVEALGYGKLPVCVAKTQRSLSDDPTLLGRPRGFRITVSDVYISAGAGFLVAITGDITTMPGFPRKPNAEGVDVAPDGRITGLF